MAGVTIDDSKHGRIASMWHECGIQFRSNIVAEVGGEIPLHAHSYDHVAVITHGLFDVREVSPSGEETNYQMASKEWPGLDYRKIILAGSRHSFVLREHKGQPGEVLCMWGG